MVKTFKQFVGQLSESVEQELNKVISGTHEIDLASKKEKSKLETALKRAGYKLSDLGGSNDDGGSDVWIKGTSKIAVEYDYAGNRGRFSGYVHRMNEETSYPQFSKGQKVKDNFGKVHTVDSQNGAQVFVDGDPNKWYHPTKIHVVKEEVMTESTKEPTKMRDWIIYQLEKTDRPHDEILADFKKKFGADKVKQFDKIVNEIIL